MTRFTSRGRNHWHSDGRPAGFGAPLADAAAAAAGWNRIAVAVAALLGVAAFLSWCGSL